MVFQLKRLAHIVGLGLGPLISKRKTPDSTLKVHKYRSVVETYQRFAESRIQFVVQAEQGLIYGEFCHTSSELDASLAQSRIWGFQGICSADTSSIRQLSKSLLSDDGSILISTTSSYDNLACDSRFFWSILQKNEANLMHVNRNWLNDIKLNDLKIADFAKHSMHNIC